jgi:hypothetical protein
MTMAEVWFRIAEAVSLKARFICKVAQQMRTEGVISAEEYDGVMLQIDSELLARKLPINSPWYDGGRAPLWRIDDQVARIRFCTEQIKKAGKR